MRIIPLQIIRTPVMQVYGFPVWIISGPESTTILLEFVTEDQNQLLVSRVGTPGVGILRCVLVNESKVAGEDGDLACCVDPAKVKPALRGLLGVGEGGDDGIACTGG